MLRAGLITISTLACGCAPLGTSGSRLPAAGVLAAPGVRGSGPGVQILEWVVSDPDGYEIVRALAPYAHSLPDAVQGEAGLDRLRRSGLRVLAVPEKSIPALRAALRPAGPVNDRWLGEASTWSVAVGGVESSTPRRARLYDGEMLLPPGQLRLIARTWAAPTAPGVPSAGVQAGAAAIPAVMVAQLRVQNREPRGTSSVFEASRAPEPRFGAEHDGQVFMTLALEVTLERGMALVIVPCAPDIDWDDVPPPAEPRRAAPAPGLNPVGPSPDVLAEPTDPGRVAFPTSEEVAPTVKQAGPRAPTTRTLGELMLEEPTWVSPARHKAVVVLIPRPPTEFRLHRTR